MFKAGAVFDNLSQQKAISVAVRCAKSVSIDSESIAWANSFLTGSAQAMHTINERDRINVLLKFGDDRACTHSEDSAKEVRINAMFHAVSACLGISARTPRSRFIAASCGVGLSILHAEVIIPDVLSEILIGRYICPYCYKPRSEHSSKGSCLFGPYHWEVPDDL